MIHLSHRFTSASKPVASATSAPPFFNLFVISEIFGTKAQPLYAKNTSHDKQEKFIYEYILH
jgi:hypothetical protein